MATFSQDRVHMEVYIQSQQNGSSLNYLLFHANRLPKNMGSPFLWSDGFQIQ